MNKLKRILAFTGVILLLAMYVTTIFFAFFDNPNTMALLKGSIAMTIFIPCLIWIFSIFTRINKKDENEKRFESDDSK